MQTGDRRDAVAVKVLDLAQFTVRGIGDQGLADHTLVEPIPGKLLHQVEDVRGNGAIDPAPLCTLLEDGALLGHLLGLLLAHGAAQQVGPAERIAGQDLGDLHHLLLVEDDAVGGLEHRLQVRVRIGDIGPPVLAVDEVVHHAGLERPGAEQGDQGRDVLEAVGLELLDQLLHAARFELEDGGGLATLEEGEGLGVGRVDPFDVDRRGARAQVGVDGLERPVDDGEGAQAQKVELDQAGGLDVVLVELGHQVVATRLAVQRREVGQPGRGDDHAPRVLAGVAGDPLQLAPHVDQGAHLLVLLVGELEVVAVLERLVQGHAQLEGDHLGHPVDEAVGVAHHPAHVAHHRLGGHGAEGDDLGDRLAPVALGHVVDDPVAALHAEVDVEIGHGDALGIEEALEQQVVLDRVEVGDPQGEGDQRAGTRAAPRPHRDAVALGPGDEIGHDQEVAGEAHLADDPQLQFQAFIVDAAALGLVGQVPQQTALEAALQARPRLGMEELVDGHARRHRKLGQVVLAQGQLQVAALGDLHRVLQGLGAVGEQLDHLLRGAQVLLLAVVARAARVVQGAASVDADPHLVCLEVVPREEAHVVGRHHRHPLGQGQVDALLDQFRLLWPTGADQLQVIAVAEDREPLIQQGLGGRTVARQQGLGDVTLGAAGECNQPLGRRRDPVALHLGQAQVLALHVGARDQPGQVAVALLVLDQQYQSVGLVGVRRVLHPQVGPRNGLDPGRQGRLVEAHQGEQVALVGDRHRRHPRLARRLDQWLQVHQAVDQ